MASNKTAQTVRWALNETEESVDISIASSSNLQHINAQLIERGFTSRPGLALESLPTKDADKVIKCLSGMLDQRLRDLNRTEDLSTKLRTLSYDHERLQKMYESAKEAAAYAEREMNLHKSKLAALTASHKTHNAAYRKTSQDLQKVNGALLSIRASHTSELKKKDMQIERVMEKWSKLADMQIKSSSGLIVRGDLAKENTSGSSEQGLWEVALDQAEKARTQLAEDSIGLRGLLLTVVNELNSAASFSRNLAGKTDDDCLPITAVTLFPVAPADSTHEQVAESLKSLRESIEALAKCQHATPNNSQATVTTAAEEVADLQKIVATLKTDLATAQELVQAVVEVDINPQPLTDGLVTSTKAAQRHRSFEGITAPARDEEQNIERENTTQADVKLGVERAVLRAERPRLADEKESWNVEQLLTDLSPTPAPDTAVPTVAETRTSLSLPKSRHRSPSLRSSKSRKHSRSPRKDKQQSFEPSYETEVIPHRPLSQSLLPTTFELPPPSPHTTLQFPPLALPAPASSPMKYPFPVAKPLMTRMIHAYSPARPSPLSRILLLSHTPNDAGATNSLAAVLEGLEADDDHSSRIDNDAPVLPHAEFGDEKDKVSLKNSSVLTFKVKTKGKGLGKGDKLVGPGTKEKENAAHRAGKGNPSVSIGTSDLGRAKVKVTPIVIKSKKSSISGVRSFGGARRVPINSAEAGFKFSKDGT